MESLLSLPPSWQGYLPVALKALVRAAPTNIRDTLRLRNGTAITLRAARPDDKALIQRLMQGLSMRTRYLRFFYPAYELTDELLERFTQTDPQRGLTVLAFIQQADGETPIAMAQYVADPFPERGDFAVVVADEWQSVGLGRKLIETLICLARTAGFERLEGDVLTENEPMRRLMLGMGFRMTLHPEEASLFKVTTDLLAEECKGSPLTALATRIPEPQPARA
jgi:GNAT superfamily N-acetyltransferase